MRRKPEVVKKSNTLGSSNWSGYQVNTSNPHYALAAWTVPDLSARPTIGGAVFSSAWPGIGGGFSGGSGKPIQSGTEQDATCVNGQTGLCSGPVTYDYYFWIEIVPGEYQQEITNLYPSPGDSVSTDAYWSSSTGAQFDVCDFTKNTCVAGSQPSTAPSNTAEWITERTEINGSLPSLANFGTDEISDCGYDLTDRGQVGFPIDFNGAAAAIVMYGNNDVLAAPSSINGTAFNDTWENYN